VTREKTKRETLGRFQREKKGFRFAWSWRDNRREKMGEKAEGSSLSNNKKKKRMKISG